MRSIFTTRKAVMTLAVMAALNLSAWHSTAIAAEIPVTAEAASTAATTQVTQRILGDGLYELVYSPKAQALYIAGSGGFKKDVNGGVIYRLDPMTLAIKGETYTDLKNFGTAIDPDGSVFYTTNTLDGGITKVDAQSGKVLQRLMFNQKNEKGNPVSTREILWHDGNLYVGGVANPGVIWVVDAKTMRLKTEIKNAGKWVTGIIYSPVKDRIYAANGSGTILVIDPRSNKVEKQWSAGDDKDYMFLNMAEDPATGRLFVTDNSKAKATLVFDERSGKVIKRIDGDALGIKFNPVRNEIYISQRASRKVLQLDATTYAVKNSWSFENMPNSLLLSPDGQVLYVSIKQSINKDRSTNGADSIARIMLR